MINPFPVTAVSGFDGAVIPGKQYRVIDTCIANGKDWYKLADSENGYTWIPSHVFERT